MNKLQILKDIPVTWLAMIDNQQLTRKCLTVNWQLTDGFLVHVMKQVCLTVGLQSANSQGNLQVSR